MAKLTAEKRRKLPKSDFAEPGKRKYPVEDRSHAKSALARVAHNGTSAEKKAVETKVHKKFPGMKLKGKSATMGRKPKGKKRSKAAGKR